MNIYPDTFEAKTGKFGDAKIFHFKVSALSFCPGHLLDVPCKQGKSPPVKVKEPYGNLEMVT